MLFQYVMGENDLAVLVDVRNLSTGIKFVTIINNVINKAQEPMGAFLDEAFWTQSLWSDCMPNSRMV
jgi:hypothetical protein